METRFIHDAAPDGIHDEVEKNSVKELSKLQEIGMLIGAFIGGALVVALVIMEANR